MSWHHIDTLSDYYLYGNKISVVDSYKDFGVLVDSSLRFYPHIRTIVNKASGLSANILRSTLCRLLTLVYNYKTHISPILEFASHVWHTGFLGDLSLMNQYKGPGLITLMD